MQEIWNEGLIAGERNDNPLQYSWLENPMDRGAWRMCLPQTWAGSGSSNAVMEASEEAKTASGLHRKGKAEGNL